jgi:hypothetical protein
VGNFSEALAAEIERLRKVLERIRDTPGNDVNRLKAIAMEGLEKTRSS